MTEQEYILEVLCTCYTIEELNSRYHKLCNDNVHNNSNSFRQSDVNLWFRWPEQEDGIIYECRTIKCNTK